MHGINNSTISRILISEMIRYEIKITEILENYPFPFHNYILKAKNGEKN